MTNYDFVSCDLLSYLSTNVSCDFLSCDFLSYAKSERFMIKYNTYIDKL